MSGCESEEDVVFELRFPAEGVLHFWQDAQLDLAVLD
jgi:hypothetical protein